jgi:tetratricopeptide (TPR) repeat protein
MTGRILPQFIKLLPFYTARIRKPPSCPEFDCFERCVYVSITFPLSLSDGFRAFRQTPLSDLRRPLPYNRRSTNLSMDEGTWVIIFCPAGIFEGCMTMTKTMTIDEALQMAVQRHQARQLSEAEALYRQVLASQPNHPDALHLLGVLASQVKRHDMAVNLISRAVQVNPNVPEFHLNLGVALDESGRTDDAISSYNRALAIKPDYPQALSNLSNALRKKGRLQEAINACRQAIAILPDFPEAHNNLGNALQAVGAWNEAVAHFQQALALRPNFPQTYANLGAVLLEMHRVDESIEASRRAIALASNFGDPYNNLGRALLEKGQVDEAILACRQAVVLLPNVPEPLYNLGNALATKGHHQEAITCFNQYLQLRPGTPELFNNLGNALHGARRFDKAIESYRQAIALAPTFVQAWSNLGNTLHEIHLEDQAIEACRQALLLAPDLVEAHSNLGNALQESGRVDESIPCYHQAIALNPLYPDAHNNLGNALYVKGQLEDAIECYKKALSLRPKYAAALNNMANALCCLGNIEAAIDSCKKGLELQPDFAAGHWSLGLMLLMLGRLEEGWKEYEWRWKVRELKLSLNFPQPLWDGSPLNGKRILLHAEQGFGDTIQFIRYFDWVRKQGGRIVLACQPEMYDLMKVQGGCEQILTMDQPLPQFDVHCPLLTLPKIWGTTLENIPAEVPYLKVDEEMKQKWGERMKAAAGDRLKIGIAWAGRPTHPNDRNRTFPLSMLAPLAEARNVWFCSLQKGEASKQTKNPPPGMDVVDWMEEVNNFNESSALIANLDMIISADTSVVHIGAALAKPTWVFIPFVPDWRWLLKREDTPWYPTMRLFRQPGIGKWEEPLAAVVKALKEKTGTP